MLQSLITVRGLADRLGVSLSHAKSLVRKKEIKSFSIGRCRRITEDALDEFVQRLSAEEGAR